MNRKLSEVMLDNVRNLGSCYQHWDSLVTDYAYKVQQLENELDRLKLETRQADTLKVGL